MLHLASAESVPGQVAIRPAPWPLGSRVRSRLPTPPLQPARNIAAVQQCKVAATCLYHHCGQPGTVQQCSGARVQPPACAAPLRPAWHAAAVQRCNCLPAPPLRPAWNSAAVQRCKGAATCLRHHRGQPGTVQQCSGARVQPPACATTACSQHTHSPSG